MFTKGELTDHIIVKICFPLYPAISRKRDPKQNVKNKLDIASLVFTAFIPGSICQAFIFAAAIFESPYALRYYTSFIQEHFEISSFYLVPILFLFEFFIFLHMWGAMLFYTFSFILWSFSSFYWIQKMRFVWQKFKNRFNFEGSLSQLTNYFCFFSYDKKLTLAELIAWPSSLRIRVIRCLAITYQNFAEGFSRIVVPAHMAILLFCHSGSNYAMLRFYDDSSLLIYLVWPLISMAATVFETVAYSFAANLYEESRRQLRSARRLKEPVHLKKQYLAIRPIRVDVGFFFPFQKVTILTFTRVNIDNTITALLI